MLSRKRFRAATRERLTTLLLATQALRHATAPITRILAGATFEPLEPSAAATYTVLFAAIATEISEMQIAPGTVVALEIAKTPKSAAAKKTLIRVCRKDARIAKPHRRQKAKRPSWQDWIRGGKFWHHQMKSAPPVKLNPGERYSIRATLDVIRDLESVEPYVKVTPQ